MNINDQIRDVLKSGPLSLGQICDALSLDSEDRRTATKRLFAMKSKGELNARLEGILVVYELNPNYVQKRRRRTEETAAPISGPAVSSKPARRFAPIHKSAEERKARKDYFKAAESFDKTLKALEFNVSVAEDALETYIHSVANAAVYAALSASRDQAREALRAFTAKP